MRYVIIRDDDTNALTPVECLERLYRPFLDRGLPVNLATIPEVSLKARMGDGRQEGFLVKGQAVPAGSGVRAEAERVLASRQSVDAMEEPSPGQHLDSYDASQGADSCVPLAANRVTISLSTAATTITWNSIVPLPPKWFGASSAGSGSFWKPASHRRGLSWPHTINSPELR